MALSFPRDMTTGRRWSEARFRLHRRQEMSRTAGGSPVVADIGPPLWRASFQSVPLERRAADALLADFESLGGGLRTFYGHPADRPRPGAYTSVSSFDLANVTVRAVSADRQRIGLDGLPSGFQLTAGDYVSVTTGAGGREFLALQEGGEADSKGSAPMLTVTQPIRPSVDAGDGVDLDKPLMEMVLEPGTLRRETYQTPYHTVLFDAWQVVR